MLAAVEVERTYSRDAVVRNVLGVTQQKCDLPRMTVLYTANKCYIAMGRIYWLLRE